MRADEVTRLLAGSIAVYLIMAACSGSGPRAGAPHDAGSASGSDATAYGDDEGVLDALTDPVTEARADPYQSGTRLKASYWAGTDGSKQFTGWHDSQRNEDCSFTTAADGSTRCTPNAAFSSTYFADANCTQPVYVVGSTCESLPPYVTSATIDSKFPTPGFNAHIFPLASAATVSTGYGLTIISDGGCNGPFHYTCMPVAAWGSVIAAPAIVYTVGAEIPPSAFVEATVQTDP
jgi:hypothetical protein